MKKAILILSLLVGLVFPGNVKAGGLSTSFGDIFIENLEIGETYSTKELINLPLRIRNDSPYEMDIKVEVMLPSKGDLKEGFEPLPGPHWITFERSTFTVTPGGMAETDVLINIPKDKKLRGKQFQVYLHSYTVPRPEKPLQISVGLASRLLFTVAEKEGMRRRGDEVGVFQVVPDDLFLVDVPLGKRVNVWEQFGKSLTVHNPNKVECRYQIESITLKEGDCPVRRGFEETPDPKYLVFDNMTIRVAPRSSERVMLYLNVPDRPENREKNLMFLVRVKQLTGRIRVAVNSRIYVMTR
ncbi:MAG: hypothetical protein OEY92_00030 [Elusimicrobiota bacterium]|nr:hypothetical protein [Elusimicrobiota bacterium]